MRINLNPKMCDNTAVVSPSRALAPVCGRVAGLPAAAAEAVENVTAAVVEEAAGTADAADAASEEQEEHGSGSNIEPPHQLALASYSNQVVSYFAVGYGRALVEPLA